MEHILRWDRETDIKKGRAPGRLLHLSGPFRKKLGRHVGILKVTVTAGGGAGTGWTSYERWSKATGAIIQYELERILPCPLP